MEQKIRIIPLNGMLYGIDMKKEYKISPGEVYYHSYESMIRKASAYGWGEWNLVVFSNDPSLKELPILPEIEEEFDKLKAAIEIVDSIECSKNEELQINLSQIKRFILAASKKGSYTEEDMRKLYEGTLQNVGTCVKQSDMPTWEQVLTSLKPIPTHVSVETEIVPDFDNNGTGEVFHNNRKEIIKVNEHNQVIIKQWYYENI